LYGRGGTEGYFRRDPLSAEKIPNESHTLTYGKLDSPVETVYSTKTLLIEQFHFGDRACCQKTELAPTARALFAQNAQRSQAAYEGIPRAKPSKSLLRGLGETHQLFHRLGLDINFQAE
jgi:hypothetical protein